jgi:hypothetical protein
MDLILFSCKARINSYFRQHKIQRVILLALGIILSGFYGWLFSSLLAKANSGNISLGAEQMISYVNLLLIAFIILRSFFPAYLPKAELIPRMYPVTSMQKFWTELVVEFASPFYFILINFFILLFVNSPDYTLLHLFQSMLVFVTALITRRSLQIFVERKIKWFHINFITATIFAGAFIALQAKVPMYKPAESVLMLVVHLSALGFFIASNYFLELAAAEPKSRVVTYSQNRQRSLSWRLFVNSKQAKQLLSFGIGFKVLMLAADAVSFSLKGIHLYDKNVSIWLFISPLVLYSYVFNNVWGFYKNIWLTVERASGSTADFLKASLMPLRIPLLVDAALLVLYVVLFNQGNALFVLAMYIASVLVLTPMGIVASFVSPKVVRGGVMSFSTKTSYLSNFISIGLVGLLFLPLLHPLLYMIYPLVIGGAFFALIAVSKEYKKYKYNLFEKLFKTEV